MACAPSSLLATRSRALRTRELPLAYCSQHPCWPQPHRMPLGTTRMWPISAATPKPPRNSWPRCTMPPPMPVPIVTSSRSSVSSPAPNRELAPRRSVGVVLDDDWQVDERPYVLAERLLAPVDVGREANRGAVFADEACGSDADAGSLLVTDQAFDEVRHDRRDLGRIVGRRLGRRVEDLAILGDEPRRDLGSADVDANGQCHVSSRGVESGVDELAKRAGELCCGLRDLGQRLGVVAYEAGDLAHGAPGRRAYVGRVLVARGMRLRRHGAEQLERLFGDRADRI